MNRNDPPARFGLGRLSRALLRLCIDPIDREPLAGDLAEAYHRMRRRKRLVALAFYWLQLVWACCYSLRDRLRDRLAHWPPRLPSSAWTGLPMSFRPLIRRPLLPACCVGILALGLTLNGLMLGFLRTTVLGDFPYPDSKRLRILLLQSLPEIKRYPVALPEALDYRNETSVFEEAALFRAGLGMTLRLEGSTLPVDAAFVTSSYFRALRVPPRLGRAFSGREDEALGDAAVVVLSHAFWSDALKADPEVLGRRLELSGHLYQVIGIMPEGFVDLASQLSWENSGPAGRSAQIWLPLSMGQPYFGADVFESRMSRQFGCLVRLSEGTSEAQAQGEIIAVSKRLAGRHPDSQHGWSPRLMDLREYLYGPSRAAAAVLFGGSLLVFAVCGLNVAAMLTQFFGNQWSAFSVHRTLGAARSRLVGQMMIQAVALAVLSGVVSIALLAGLTPAIADWSALSSSWLSGIRWDWPSAAAMLLATPAVGLAAGAYPSWRFSRGATHAALPTWRSSPATREGRGIIVALVTVAMVLAVGAGLTLKSVLRLTSAPMGYSPDRLLTMRLDLTHAQPPPRQERLAAAREANEQKARIAFAQRFLERVRTLPQVESAGLIGPNPVGGALWSVGVAPERTAPGSEGRIDWHQRVIVSHGTLETLGIRLVAGRSFEAQDRRRAQAVALIDQRVAQRHWPGMSPLGERFRSEPPMGGPWTVIGIVENARHRGRYRPDEADVYFPYYARPCQRFSAVIRVRGEMGSLPQQADWIAKELEPRAALFDPVFLNDRLEAQEALPRLTAWLVSGYALATALLSFLGIGCTVAHATNCRSREIAVRSALGATRGALRGLLLRRGVKPIPAASLLGLCLSPTMTIPLASVLQDMESVDWTIFAAALAAVLAISGLGCWIPVRRAARSDPLQVLRG